MMDATSPKYLRARIDMFRDVISKTDPKGKDTPLIRNGVFPHQRDEQELVEFYAGQKQYSTEGLSFTELCTFNTWFMIHPEKVCGEQLITTSREFPITIKGNKETILESISKTLTDSGLLFDLPQSWQIESYDPMRLEFDVVYKNPQFKINIYQNDMQFSMLVFREDLQLQESHFSTIDQANHNALRFMENHSGKNTFTSELEVEALALELELQLNQI